MLVFQAGRFQQPFQQLLKHRYLSDVGNVCLADVMSSCMKITVTFWRWGGVQTSVVNSKRGNDTCRPFLLLFLARWRKKEAVVKGAAVIHTSFSLKK